METKTKKIYWTLSDAIVAEDWNKRELAEAFGIEESQVAEAQYKITRALYDYDISESKFQDICDEVDSYLDVAELN